MGDSFKTWRGGQGDVIKRMGLSVKIYKSYYVIHAGQVGG